MFVSLMRCVSVSSSCGSSGCYRFLFLLLLLLLLLMLLLFAFLAWVSVLAQVRFEVSFAIRYHGGWHTFLSMWHEAVRYAASPGELRGGEMVLVVESAGVLSFLPRLPQCDVARRHALPGPKPQAAALKVQQLERNG